MNDIRSSIRNWIESAANAVTAEEAIQRASEKEASRHETRRGWAVALGAAALVLLAIGLPFMLRDPEPSTDAGSASDTTVTAATVPDWEGRSIDDVRAEADLLEINLHEEPTEVDNADLRSVVSQEPAPGTPIPEDGTVTVGVATAPESRPTTTSSTPAAITCSLPEPQPQSGKRYVSVFYGCETGPDDQVQPALHAIPSQTKSFMLAAMQSLLNGPTADEREVGLVSDFEHMEDVLNSVTFESGNVTVDFATEATSRSIQQHDITALFATAFQFETTAMVEMAIDGSCEDFADWSGRSCSIQAEDWWHEGLSRELIVGWPRVAARLASVSGECDVDAPEPEPDEVLVDVVYSCRSGDDALLELTTVSRVVPAESNPIRATLNEAVKGPNGAERAEGVSGSFLSERTALMVRNVEMDGSRLIVDFHPFVRSPEVSNVSTSTGGMIFNTILNANLFQYPEVEEIEYRVDGSCDAYWAIFEGDCFIHTRATHRDAVDDLS